MARMRSDKAHQGADIRKQANDEIKAAACNRKGVTVTNGAKTSVSCPQVG
jgi:hypothetical protein